jgi:hypothetical protein
MSHQKKKPLLMQLTHPHHRLRLEQYPIHQHRHHRHLQQSNN